jgi:hypothetical protein
LVGARCVCCARAGARSLPAPLPRPTSAAGWCARPRTKGHVSRASPLPD